MAKKKAVKKKAVRKPKPPATPTKAKFPPRLDVRGVVIRGVDYMPIGGDTDTPQEDG